MRICEVGPRDGLQNESVVLNAGTRAELVNRLAAAGLEHIEAGSFVSPKAVPAMRDAEAVFEGIRREPRRTYSALILNERGYERAKAAGADEIHYALPCSDEFSIRNQGMTVAAATDTCRMIIERSRRDGKRLSIALSVAFGCPYAGPISPAHVMRIADALVAVGAEEISLADTIGVAVPVEVSHLTKSVAALGVTVGGHFHNTRNTGYANAMAALEAGASFLDASVGGLGGCPFAPKATGNIATQDLLYLLHRSGIQTGISVDHLNDIASWLSALLGRETPSLVAKVGDWPAAVSAKVS